MFSYTNTIYEKSATTTVGVDSLNEVLKLDESLDSGLMSIPRLTRSTPFERFARVNLLIKQGTTTVRNVDYLIYSTGIEISSRGLTPKYNHTLGLIEPTKWLEKFQCDSIADTQPLGGAQKTMADVVDRLLEITPMVMYSKISSTRVVTIDSNLHTYLAAITAPQIYIEKKNLREALIYIFRMINAVPRMRYYNGWVLDADFLGNENIKMTIADKIDFSDDAEGLNFAQRIEANHENTYTDQDKIGVYGNSITDYIWFTAKDNLIVGDSNFVLESKYPIGTLLKIEAIVPGTVVRTVDLTDYIPEYNVYNTYEYDSAASYNYGSKACLGYWSYKSRYIDGLNSTYNFLGTGLALENILKSALSLQYSDTLNANWNWEKTIFKIQYVPYIESMRSVQHRTDYEPYEIPADMFDKYSTIQVNQNERVNDLFSLTSNINGLIQRVGVDTVAFSKLHRDITPYSATNTDGVYSVGDYTDDGFFVTKIEYVYFTTFVIVRYELSKNWNRLAQFIQISKEFRAYEVSLEKTNRTVRRNILMPLGKIEISNTSNANEGTDLYSNYRNIKQAVLDTFKGAVREPAVTSLALQVGSISGGTPSFNTDGVFMPLQIGAEKNTIKLKCDFDNTKLAGTKVFYNGTYELRYQVNYTEDDGTAEIYKLSLYKNLFNYYELTTDPVADRVDRQGLVARKFPYVEQIEDLSQDQTTYPFDAIIQGTVLTGSKIAYNYLAHVYEYETDFTSTSGITNDYYVGMDTKVVYKYDGSVYNSMGILTAIQQDSVYTVPLYKVRKDAAESLGLELYLPFIVKKDIVDLFIIGDSLIKDNALITENTATKTLYWVAQNDRYVKYATQKVYSTQIQAFNATNDLDSSGLIVPSNVYANNNFALVDSNNNLYIAVNQIGFDGNKTTVSKIYFNMISYD